jgi:type I restriction enzyme S subunit
MKKGWETKTLGDTCEMYQPQTISTKELISDGPYPVFGANGIIGRYDRFNHEKPQLLVTCRGATCGAVNISEPRSWITGNAMVVRPKDSCIEMRFLEYLFRGRIDISKAITGAAQPQITRTNLAPLEICYPKSLAEQRRIVTVLDEAFAGLATAQAHAEKNLQNARAVFESHLNAVFNQRGEGWVGKTVGGFVIDGILAAPIDGNHGEIHPKKADFVTSGVPFIMASDLENGGVNQKDCAFISRKQADSLRKGFAVDGDVLLSHKGTIGRVAILRTDHDFVILTPQVTYYRVTAPQKLLNRFLYYAFQAPDFVRTMNGIAGAGSTRAYIGILKQQELPLAFPSISEQNRLADQLDALAAETQRLQKIYEKKKAALAELKKSLLHQAFSGDL